MQEGVDHIQDWSDKIQVFDSAFLVENEERIIISLDGIIKYIIKYNKDVEKDIKKIEETIQHFEFAMKLIFCLNYSNDAVLTLTLITTNLLMGESVYFNHFIFENNIYPSIFVRFHETLFSYSPQFLQAFLESVVIYGQVSDRNFDELITGSLENNGFNFLNCYEKIFQNYSFQNNSEIVECIALFLRLFINKTMIDPNVIQNLRMIIDIYKMLLKSAFYRPADFNNFIKELNINHNINQVLFAFPQELTEDFQRDLLFNIKDFYEILMELSNQHEILFEHNIHILFAFILYSSFYQTVPSLIFITLSLDILYSIYESSDIKSRCKLIQYLNIQLLSGLITSELHFSNNDRLIIYTFLCFGYSHSNNFISHEYINIFNCIVRDFENQHYKTKWHMGYILLYFIENSDKQFLEKVYNKTVIDILEELLDFNDCLASKCYLILKYLSNNPPTKQKTVDIDNPPLEQLKIIIDEYEYEHKINWESLSETTATWI